MHDGMMEDIGMLWTNVCITLVDSSCIAGGVVSRIHTTYLQ